LFFVQALKYQQRDGWSHRDLLRLSHPQPASDSHHTIYHWMTRRGTTRCLQPAKYLK
jgi:60 kDa SS-A/Ro ribonucleoprotein